MNEPTVSASTVSAYGVWIDITNAMTSWPPPHTADVVVSYNGIERKFTYQEFLLAVGFDADSIRKDQSELPEIR